MKLVMVDRVNKFLIGSWITYFDYSIMSQEEQMQRLVRLGINYQPFPYSWYQDETHDDLEDWKEIDRLCQKYDVYYGMRVATEGRDKEEEFQKGIAYGKEMSDKLIVYHVKDEPNFDEIEELGSWIRRYRQANDKVGATFNLHPSYAPVRLVANSYRGYIQSVIDAAGADNMFYLSMDHYPFRASRTRMEIFEDLEDVRALAIQNGKLRTHGFLQSCKWKYMRMPNIDEIRWSAYAHIAYGFKALSYFNIVLPTEKNSELYTDGLIRQDGTVCDEALLEAVGELNQALHAVGTEALPLHAMHAYHTHAVAKYIELLPENYPIAPVEKEHKFVVTEFDDERYFMLFNNDFEREVEAEFIVKGATSVRAFNVKTNEYEACALYDGKIKVAFAKGEGLLFRKD